MATITTSAGGDGPAGTVAPLLSLKHASKAFAGVHALQDVSLDLYPGEAHALVGRTAPESRH